MSKPASVSKVVRRKRIQRLEISANIAEVYGASVSRETVSKITNQVLEEMGAGKAAGHGCDQPQEDP
jgi:transposase-like protein